MRGLFFFISFTLCCFYTKTYAADIHTPASSVQKTSAAEAASQAPEEISSKDRVLEFFLHCRRDLGRASDIILKEDIIRNLTHLQNMDRGGKKFYPLERENISAMIKSVTEELYDDCIIINEKGTVIYTKNSDSLFGTDIMSLSDYSALKKGFTVRDKVWISDASKIDGLKGEYIIFSQKVKGGDSLPGTLILQMKTSRIKKVLQKSEFIIGAEDGKYRVSHEAEKEQTLYEFFPDINKKLLSADRSVLILPKQNISGRLFCFGNFCWIILKNRSLRGKDTGSL